MAAGLPVIVSDQVAIHQEIATGGAGLVIPCSVPALVAALDKLLADAEMRSAMGRNGRLLANKEYSVQTVTDELLSLYRDIARSPAAAMKPSVQQFNLGLIRCHGSKLADYPSRAHLQ